MFLRTDTCSSSQEYLVGKDAPNINKLYELLKSRYICIHVYIYTYSMYIYYAWVFFLTSNAYPTPQLPFSFWDRVLCILELRMTLNF